MTGDGTTAYTPSTANGTPAWGNGISPGLYSPPGANSMPGTPGGGGAGVPATPGFDVPGPAMPKRALDGAQKGHHCHAHNTAAFRSDQRKHLRRASHGTRFVH